MEYAIAAAQALALYMLHRIDTRLDKHEDRLNVLEKECAARHGEHDEKYT